MHCPLKAVWVGGVQITGEWQDPSLTKGLTWWSSRYRYIPLQHRRCPRSDPGWHSWQSRPTGPACTWTRPSPGCSGDPTTTRATSSATSWISSSLKYYYLMFNFIIWAKNDETFLNLFQDCREHFYFKFWILDKNELLGVTTYQNYCCYYTELELSSDKGPAKWSEHAIKTSLCQLVALLWDYGPSQRDLPFMLD